MDDHAGSDGKQQDGGGEGVIDDFGGGDGVHRVDGGIERGPSAAALIRQHSLDKERIRPFLTSRKEYAVCRPSK